MPLPQDVEPTEEITTTEDSADETATNVSPVDDASSSAESTAEEAEAEVELTPEQIVEKEKAARQAARVKAAEEAEQRSEAERKERRKRREAEEYEERVRAREQAANDTLRQAKELIDELRQRKETVLRGGPDALRALGVDYGDWTQKELERTGPDAVARQALERAERLEAEIRRRDQEAEQQAQAARARAQQAESAKKFEAFVDGAADDFPSTATLPTRVLHILAEETAYEYRRATGGWPSFSALIERLDEKAKDFHAEQQAKSAKRARPTTTPSDGAPTTQATIPGQPASTPANRTLTPATATTRATPRRAMTPEEEDEWCLTELRTAMAADTKRDKATG